MHYRFRSILCPAWIRWFLLSALWAASACYTESICLSQPTHPACIPPPKKVLLSKMTGGDISVVLADAVDQKSIVLNQTSTSSYYVIGRLLQQGVRSLDLTLELGTNPGEIRAHLFPIDLQPFQLGAATLQLTTPHGSFSFEVDLQ